MIDAPRQVRQRLRLVAPRKLTSQPPAPSEVGDKHFSLAVRYEVEGNTLNYVLTYNRRSDEVLPGDLAGYRERVQAARKLGGVTARLPLLDFDGLRSAFDELERRVQRNLGQETDTLREIVIRQEVERLLATETLMRAGPDSPLAAAALERRAIANSMLNDFRATLSDADRALAAAPEVGYSHYTRGLALLSLGRADEAVTAMQQFKNPNSRAFLDRGTGGKGKAALVPYLAGVDKSSWPGVLVHYLAGNTSQDDLLKAARQDKRMERLNLAEAYFYVGQQLLLNGKTDDARRMFQRTVEIKATPYREHSLAEMELKRAASQ